MPTLVDLHFVTLAGRTPSWARLTGKPGIVRETPIWRELVAIVEKDRPRLVILDTLADVFAGNEIARQEARQFVGLLRGLAIAEETAVVLLAHPSLAGMANGSGTSGSTAWSNSVRSRLYLETIKGDDGREIDADLRVLRTKKSNYGPDRLGNPACDGRMDASSARRRQAASTSSRRPPRPTASFSRCSKTFNAQDRAVSASPSNTYAPTLFASHPQSEGMTKRALTDAMNRLLAAKSIGVETTGSPSKRRQRLIISSPEAAERSSERDDL